MKSLFLAATFLLAAASAQAGERLNTTLSWVSFAGGQAADVATTYRNLPMGGGHCIEGNSGFYGSATPSLGRVLLGKAVIMAPMATLSVLLDRQGKHRPAQVLRHVAGGIGGSAALWNLSRSCR